MGFRLEVRSVGSRRDVERLRVFLLGQALWYPRYEDWVCGRCIPDVHSGRKSAFVAYADGEVVGNAIYQPHGELPRTRELKNLRVHPRFRRRDLAHFLIRQAEEEDRGTFDRIVCDADARQLAVRRLLLFSGYRPVCETPLYCSDNVDVVFHKEFGDRDA